MGLLNDARKSDCAPLGAQEVRGAMERRHDLCKSDSQNRFDHRNWLGSLIGKSDFDGNARNGN
jgi:hypothetical protein